MFLQIINWLAFIANFSSIYATSWIEQILSINFRNYKTLRSKTHLWLIDLCLTPILTVFQVYRDVNKFYKLQNVWRTSATFRFQLKYVSVNNWNYTEYITVVRRPFRTTICKPIMTNTTSEQDYMLKYSQTCLSDHLYYTITCII